MLLLMCLVYGSFGMVSASLAPLIAPILRDLDMTRTSMGLVLGSWQFVYLFVAIPAGAAIDRFGLKRALLIGICFVALSQIIRAGATHQYILLAAVMVFGLGGPFISVGAPKLTSLWFPQKEVGSALGIYTVSPSFGSMIAVSTANSLLMPLYDNSWRLTLLSFAGIAVMAAIMWLLFARDPEAGQSSAPASGEKAPTMFAAFGYLIKLPLVQIVLVMATGTFLFNHSFNNWLPEVLRTGGMTPSDAGYWASFPTFVAIFAALIIPRYTSERWLTLVQVAVFGLWGLSCRAHCLHQRPPALFWPVPAGHGARRQLSVADAELPEITQGGAEAYGRSGRSLLYRRRGGRRAWPDPHRRLLRCYRRL